MRVLVGIQGCEKHADRMVSQRFTWANDYFDKDNPRLMFFTGPFLGVSDDYSHMPEKHQAMCRWMLKEGYDYIFKCDTDTYVAMDRLKVPEEDYVGHRSNEYPYAAYGGPGYWLSRKAAFVIAKASIPDWRARTEPSLHGFDDLFVGFALESSSIYLRHDHRYALYQQPEPDNDIITAHLSSRQPFTPEIMYEAHRRYECLSKTAG